MTDKKTILITGAAHGIGRASALQLMKDGHIVYGGDVDFEGMADLETEGMNRLAMDVTDAQAVTAGVEKMVAEQGSIDGLFANAGYTCMGMIECAPIEEAQRNFDVNVFGVARVVRAVLPHMRAAGKGHIVITSSVVGLVPAPGMAWYPATKHALEAFSAALRMEVKRFGIKVAIINPGFIRTGLLNASLHTLDIAERSEHASVYAEDMRNFRTNFTNGFNGGAAPETISEAVSRAFSSDNPRKHYRPNLDSVAGMLTAKLAPASVEDAFLTKNFIGTPSS